METTRNMTLKIDPDSMDLVMDDGGDFALIYGDETTAQAVRLTLQAWEGDFPLDESHGTEWGQILGRKPSDLGDDEAAEVIRKAIFQEDDVQQAQQLGGYSLVVTFLLDIIVGLFPGFLILSWILQFYLVYVVWEGVRVLVAIADNRQLPYTVMASVLLIACPALIDFVFDKLMNWLD